MGLGDKTDSALGEAKGIFDGRFSAGPSVVLISVSLLTRGFPTISPWANACCDSGVRKWQVMALSAEGLAEIAHLKLFFVA